MNKHHDLSLKWAQICKLVKALIGRSVLRVCMDDTIHRFRIAVRSPGFAIIMGSTRVE